MGDSILNNVSYVPAGKNIEALLKKQTPDGNVVNLAKTDAIMTQIPPQIDQLRELDPKYNDSNTIIFLSVGGNDILMTYENNETPDFDHMINEVYKKLVDSIKIVAPKAKLYLLDLYFPRNEENQKFWPIITEWNNKLGKFALNNNATIFKVSSILTEPDDFTNKIEPSATGGQKMVDAMLKLT
jgi:lysophospholipase L1-like esterase